MRRWFLSELRGSMWLILQRLSAKITAQKVAQAQWQARD
jgi:hypothetical protein